MSIKLHVFLKSEDPLFSFTRDDFEPVRQAHPTVELVFHDHTEQLVATLPEIEYLDTWYFESEWYDAAPRLKQIFTPAAGKEYVKTSPRVTASFGAFHGALMAETTLGLILNFSLRLREFRDQQASRVWQRLPLKRLVNQTVLILGYGSIGQVCGQLLAQQGMAVTGVKRRPASGWDGDVKLIPVSELESFLPLADHVVSFLPSDETTQKLISTDKLSLMSPNAYLYNLGRGTTIDESALLEALANKQIAGAALDVTAIEPLPADSELWQDPRLVLLPHTSAYFEEYRHAHVMELTEHITRLKQSLSLQ